MDSPSTCVGSEITNEIHARRARSCETFILHHIVTDVFSSLVLWKVLNENLKIPEQAPAKDMNAK